MRASVIAHKSWPQHSLSKHAPDHDLCDDRAHAKPGEEDVRWNVRQVRRQLVFPLPLPLVLLHRVACACTGLQPTGVGQVLVYVGLLPLIDWRASSR